MTGTDVDKAREEGKIAALFVHRRRGEALDGELSFYVYSTALA